MNERPIFEHEKEKGHFVLVYKDGQLKYACEFNDKETAESFMCIDLMNRSYVVAVPPGVEIKKR